MSESKGHVRFGVSQVEASGAWAERRRLAAAMREVMGHLVTSEAPEPELRAAADALERYAERLRGHPMRKGWEGFFREASTAGDVSEFFDFSPLIGLSNPIAPPIEMWVDETDAPDAIDSSNLSGRTRVRGRAVFGAAYEGPPGHVHGGYVAAAFDEVLGYAQSLTESPGMTGRLIVHYRRPTPLHTELEFEGRVLRVEGRKILTEATLSADGELCAESEGLFVRVLPGRMQELAARRQRNASGPG